ncbi:MAG: DUF202 domain-containing protein [Planctomycetota bacterium]
MSQGQDIEDPRVTMARHRTAIAGFRTELAMDRTTLAWIRTTLSIAGFGFGMVGFFRTLEERNPTVESAKLHRGAIRFGVALIILGLVATVLASLSHWRSLQKIRRGECPVPAKWPLSITIGFLLAILGLVGLFTIFV